MASTSVDFPRTAAWLEEYEACHALLRKLNTMYTETHEENKALRMEIAQLDKRLSSHSEQPYDVENSEHARLKPDGSPRRGASTRILDANATQERQTPLTLDIESRQETLRMLSSSAFHILDIKCCPTSPSEIHCPTQPSKCHPKDETQEGDCWTEKDDSSEERISPSRQPKSTGSRTFDSPLERWTDVVYFALNPDEAAGSPAPPPDLGIHQTWLIAKHHSSGSTLSLKAAESTQSETIASVRPTVDFDSTGLYIMTKGHPLQKLVMDPTGRKAMMWGVLGASLISYDAVTLPLMLFSLHTHTHETLAHVNTFTLSYWILDVIVQMLMGFRTHGRIDLRPNKIICRYATTWLVSDMFLIAMDLALLSLTRFKGSSSLRMVRILRLMRVLRLLRIRRLNNVVIFGMKIIMNVDSTILQLLFSLLQNIFVVLLVTHYIACVWFYVGWASVAHVGYDSSWITATSIENAGAQTQYAFAFHWSLTQFSPATNNISPQNASERAFACVVVMFAIIAFSSFISNVTGTVAQIRQVNAKRFAEEGLIRNFINERQISLDLAYDIMQFFRSNHNRSNTRVHEKAIKIFADLPERMLLRLHSEMYSHMWICSPLFSQTLAKEARLITKLCHETVSLQQLVAQQDVFCDEGLCLQAYYATDGVSQYRMSIFRLSTKGDLSASTVGAGAWLSEMAFWVPWTHQGGLTCSTSCEFACINCEKFGITVSTYGGILHHMISVLAIYTIGHAEARVDRGERLTDLAMDELEAEEITSRLSGFFGRSYNVDKVRSSMC